MQPTLTIIDKTSKSKLLSIIKLAVLYAVATFKLKTKNQMPQMHRLNILKTTHLMQMLSPSLKLR